MAEKLNGGGTRAAFRGRGRVCHEFSMSEAVVWFALNHGLLGCFVFGALLTFFLLGPAVLSD